MSPSGGSNQQSPSRNINDFNLLNIRLYLTNYSHKFTILLLRSSKKKIQSGVKKQEVMNIIFKRCHDTMKESKHAKHPSVVWLPIIPCTPSSSRLHKKEISPLNLGTQVFHFHCEAPDSKAKDGTQEAVFGALIVNHQEANGGQLEELQMFQLGTEAAGAQCFPHILFIQQSQMLMFVRCFGIWT